MDEFFGEEYFSDDSPNKEFPQGEELLGVVVTYLLEGDEREAVLLLIECQCESRNNWNFDVERYFYNITLKAPRLVTKVLNDVDYPLSLTIREAFREVSESYDNYLDEFRIVAQVKTPNPNWREEILQTTSGGDVHNQAISTTEDKIRWWNNLRFRSMSEVRVAEALEARNVMFFPNCKGRLSTPNGRRNKEADFLICYKGKWGVLEVDGEPFHPATRTTEDHARDRLFREHGVRLVEHFDATTCYNDADTVVGRFLTLLANS